MNKTSDKKYYSKQITARFLKAMDAIISNREEGKITAQSFGNSVGMSSSNINRLRSPTNENTVTVESLARLCDLYKISAYWLITGNGEMFNNDELITACKKLSLNIKLIKAGIDNAQEAINKIAASNKNSNKINKNIEVLT